ASSVILSDLKKSGTKGSYRPRAHHQRRKWIGRMTTRWFERSTRRIAGLPRPAKVATAMVADALAMPVLFFLAATLRYESIVAAKALPLTLYAVATAISLSVFASIGLYRAVFRFI